jgi:hypothetical protein
MSQRTRPCGWCSAETEDIYCCRACEEQGNYDPDPFSLEYEPFTTERDREIQSDLDRFSVDYDLA